MRHSNKWRYLGTALIAGLVLSVGGAAFIAGKFVAHGPDGTPVAHLTIPASSLHESVAASPPPPAIQLPRVSPSDPDLAKRFTCGDLLEAAVALHAYKMGYTTDQGPMSTITEYEAKTIIVRYPSLANASDIQAIGEFIGEFCGRAENLDKTIADVIAIAANQREVKATTPTFKAPSAVDHKAVTNMSDTEIGAWFNVLNPYPWTSGLKL